MPNARACLTFLGTGGSRFTIMHQLRASGGLWFNWRAFPVAIDPGPGALVRMCQNQPPLDPTTLEVILVTHKHLDHTTDLNVLVEAMTGGGFNKRGIVVVPTDAVYGFEPVLHKYLQKKMHRLETWKNEGAINLAGNRTVKSVPLTHHGVECHGIVFQENGSPLWGLIPDTRFDQELIEHYRKCRLLVVNMTLAKERSHLDHLSPVHVSRLVETLEPELTLLTHFGRGVLKEGPEKIAEKISKGKYRVVAARDGMRVDIDDLLIEFPDTNNKQPLCSTFL